MLHVTANMHSDSCQLRWAHQYGLYKSPRIFNWIGMKYFAQWHVILYELFARSVWRFNNIIMTGISRSEYVFLYHKTYSTQENALCMSPNQYIYASSYVVFSSGCRTVTPILFWWSLLVTEQSYETALNDISDYNSWFLYRRWYNRQTNNQQHIKYNKNGCILLRYAASM